MYGTQASESGPVDCGCTVDTCPGSALDGADGDVMLVSAGTSGDSVAVFLAWASLLRACQPPARPNFFRDPVALLFLAIFRLGLCTI